jgi:hypothetical protein
MFNYVVLVVAAVLIFVAGATGVPLSQAWFKSWSAKRALASAKALVAKAEADAAALAAARHVVANATAGVQVPSLGATGATGA